MRYIVSVLLAALLTLPGLSEGNVPVDAFLEKAGMEVDGALREKAEAFLVESGLTARSIGLMDAALIRRYAEHLAAAQPIEYAYLTDAPSVPLPADVDFSNLKCLAVLRPSGSVTQSLVVDFERGLLYADGAWRLTVDVCRASRAEPLTAETADRLIDILRKADPVQWALDYPGDPMPGVSVLALAFDTGVTRYTVAGVSQAPEALVDAMLELLAVGLEQ